MKKLGEQAPIATIASEAGVSVSTARRHLPATASSNEAEESAADARLVAV
ncbi:hypothetical protein [Mangrovihabitans endophyticus]|uniref:Uncharacterized protein n=1 Tax=Mangrovihabitans endophyticus TaxID=1751298 RepID=A0A8J3C119_9ACTN|nr:hypothetical protein [Mangrovihabitans endophyticus]GGL01829.1 hypothetical protein GCM10012284_40510 [Mangrovihabitans endophyticus]